MADTRAVLIRCEEDFAAELEEWAKSDGRTLAGLCRYLLGLALIDHQTRQDRLSAPPKPVPSLADRGLSKPQKSKSDVSPIPKKSGKK